jgi:hypothetical protein
LSTVFTPAMTMTPAMTEFVMTLRSIWKRLSRGRRTGARSEGEKE